MKQEANKSILQWATQILQQSVTSLSIIQDVKFTRNILWHVDPDYFHFWQQGKGHQTFNQVLQLISKYFKQQLLTDISHHIQGLNQYKNIYEVWQLILGIAIKGNNRSNNINLIFNMDPKIQAELVGIVTNIIDKFGQNATTIDQQATNIYQMSQIDNNNTDRQIIMQLVQQVQDLKQQKNELQTSLYKQKQQHKNLRVVKEDIERQLQMLKLQKRSFFEIVANANRSDSKIFDDEDGDNMLGSRANLTELANDIVIFIREQRKRILLQNQKNAYLQQDIKEMRKISQKLYDFKVKYQLQLTYAKEYQQQIQTLRIQNQDLYKENTDLLAEVQNINQSKNNLFSNLQKQINKQQEKKKALLPELEKQRENVKQRDRRQKVGRYNGRGRRINNDSQCNDSSGKMQQSRQSKRNQGVSIKHEIDQARQPQIRGKLQRQIAYLKSNIVSLNKQIEILKKANENLQQSAKQFMQSNQGVISKWQNDYEILIQKMSDLTQIKEGLQLQNKTIAIKLFQEDLKNQQNTKKSVSVGNNPSVILQYDHDDQPPSVSHQESSISIKEQSAIIDDKDVRDDKLKSHKVALWQQIVNKLRSIIKQGKMKEISYESTIYQLKSQNNQLLDMVRKRNNKPNLSQMQEEIVSVLSAVQEYPVIKMQRVESTQQRFGQAQLLRLTYQDQNLQQSRYSYYKDKSMLYNMNSFIAEQISQPKLKKQPSSPTLTKDQEYYMQLNKRLQLQIKQNMKQLHTMSDQQISQSLHLKQLMKLEISSLNQQYQRLNSNYNKVFQKLHIYAQKLIQKDNINAQYHLILQQIQKAEKDIKINHETQIIKLRLINSKLKQDLTRSILQKDQIISEIKELHHVINENKKKKEENQINLVKEIQMMLVQTQNRHGSNLQDPLNFMQLSIDEGDGAKRLKVYELYMRQKKMNMQLHSQIELLSGVLIQYRNILQS